MKYLVVAQSWPRVSEAWMHRINALLGPDVKFAYMYRRDKANTDDGIAVPNLRLVNRYKSALGFHFAVWSGAGEANAKLKDLLSSSPETKVLVHYLPTAVLLKESIMATNNDFFVHCHGHDVTWNRRRESFPRVRVFSKRYLQHVVELSLHCNFIANSSATRQKLLSIGLPDQKIHIKHLSVPETSKPLIVAKSATPVILFVGRLVDFKGPIETLKAFELLRQRGVEAKLRVIGDGPQARKCQEYLQGAHFSNDVTMVGELSSESVMEEMERADIFTAHNKKSSLTGQEEAFGVAIIEAMSKGLPVITGRSGGVVDTVEHGATGYLFCPGDVEGHANYLEKLIHDVPLRRQLGLQAWARVMQFFSSDRESIRLKEILNRTTRTSTF